MNSEKFYEEIKYLANELRKNKIAKYFINVAKENPEELRVEFESFKTSFPELWERLQIFYEEYINADRPVIFNEITREYEPAKVSPINLLFIFVFSEGKIDEVDIFEKYSTFYPYLKVDGYPEIAKYLPRNCIISIEDLSKAVKY